MRPTARRRRAFTLVEVIVVIFLIGLIASVTFPALLLPRPVSDPLARGTRLVTNLLARTRTTAIERGTATTLTIDATTGRYWIAMAKENGDSTIVADRFDLPAGVAFAMSAARVPIAFAPTGPASGGPLVLRAADRIAVISVEGWTGESRIATR